MTFFTVVVFKLQPASLKRLSTLLSVVTLNTAIAKLSNIEA